MGKVTLAKLSLIEKDKDLTAEPVNDSLEALQVGVNNIDSEQLNSSSVTTTKIASDAVTGAKIADDSIDSEHYVDASIDTAHLSSDCVNGNKIADDSIDSEHYVDGSVDNAHLAGSIALSKISFSTDTSGDRDNSTWGYRHSQPTGVISSTYNSWIDFDCDSYYDGTIPSGEIIAIIEVRLANNSSNTTTYFRPNGTSWSASGSASTPYIYAAAGSTARRTFLIRTDTSHIFEYYISSSNVQVKIYFLGYIPNTPK